MVRIALLPSFSSSNLQRSTVMLSHPTRRRVSIDFSNTVSMTKQSHKSECDINTIIKQFSKTGIINHINPKQAQYLDLPSNIDYQASLNLVAAAAEAFEALPSKVRDHFGNDPAQLLVALQDPAQRDQLEAFGLVNPRPAVASPAAAEPPPAAGKKAAAGGASE